MILNKEIPHWPALIDATASCWRHAEASVVASMAVKWGLSFSFLQGSYTKKKSNQKRRIVENQGQERKILLLILFTLVAFCCQLWDTDPDEVSLSPSTSHRREMDNTSDLWGIDIEACKLLMRSPIVCFFLSDPRVQVQISIVKTIVQRFKDYVKDQAFREFISRRLWSDNPCG